MPPPPVSFHLDKKVLAKAALRIDEILGDPRGLPNGKGKRTKLTPTERDKFKSKLIEVMQYAHSLAAKGALPNRVPGRGRPPDNAVFLFIDDLVQAHEEVGLKPSLRYVSPESLLVHLFIELVPLLWRPVKAPRRFFQRWQRYRTDLHRG